jgi:hypothetical protein
MEGPFLPGTETYDEFGTIRTFVRYNGDVKEKQFESLYNLSPASLMARAELYSAAAIAGTFPALIRQLRAPAIASGRLSWLGFALMSVLRFPVTILVYAVGAPWRLLSQRAARNKLLRSRTGST